VKRTGCREKKTFLRERGEEGIPAPGNFYVLTLSDSKFVMAYKFPPTAVAM
jgi:hypothetical protein